MHPQRPSSGRTRPRANAPAQQERRADAARDAALRAITRQVGLYPALDLAPPDTTNLNTRDAAFAHAIYDAVLRRWITLEYLIQSHLNRPFAQLDPPVRAALLAGAAQLILLDRVPPHAAIYESVEWAKHAWRTEAGGIVNAVLRKLAALVHGPAETGLPEARPRVRWTGERDQIPFGDGSAVVLSRPILPLDRVDRLAVATSHPSHLLRRWESRWGWERVTDLAVHNLVSPPTVLNTSFAQYLDSPQLSPHESKSHRVFRGPRLELADVLAARADLWVQDSASSRAVASIADLRPSLVIDMCAGQGTKTRQLAATFPAARIVATDVDARRLVTLRQVAGSSRRIEVVEADRLLRTFAGTADLVLADVPCSNTGVLARRVEARYRCDAAQMQRLTEIQRSILADAIALLAPKGAILYSTCSLEPEENEDQIAAATATGRLVAERQERTWPRGQPGETPERYGDGAFSALLRGV